MQFRSSLSSEWRIEVLAALFCLFFFPHPVPIAVFSLLFFGTSFVSFPLIPMLPNLIARNHQDVHNLSENSGTLWVECGRNLDSHSFIHQKTKNVKQGLEHKIPKTEKVAIIIAFITVIIIMGTGQAWVSSGDALYFCHYSVGR